MEAYPERLTRVSWLGSDLKTANTTSQEKTRFDHLMEWIESWDTPDSSHHKLLYQKQHPNSISCPIEQIPKIYNAFSHDKLTQEAIKQFLNLWGQIYLDNNTWVSSSTISNWSTWRFSMLTIGIGNMDAEWEKYLTQMMEIWKIYDNQNNDWAFEIRFRHELAHDISERYLKKIDSWCLSTILHSYQQIDWTLSVMAWNGFYSSSDKRKELGEDMAEMLSLYLKDPTLFDRYISSILQWAIQQNDANWQFFIQNFSEMVRSAYYQYIEL